ncbi:hypothetical protein ASD64_02845 [Mesorhizobium sp. Root157]|uniref:hypothetical protein n=1 Tax=Mesorhizobium sp. Root157 TaxID=1736477 RepID=UPI0006F443F1|nr:hypothetical protein [Mesorhizobium sp. Root157]KQZ93864.1 hypothetical protein ASD64_02845 [Mesorhizobium sp. Root157]
MANKWLTFAVSGGILATAALSLVISVTSETRTADTTPILDLPRIDWEGGPAYWAQFPATEKWDRPDFFPVAIWFNGISSLEEARFDKAHGVNTYMGMYEGTDFGLFEASGQYWIGGPLKNASPSSPNWVGNLLDDEVDGRFTPEEGRAHLQALVDQYKGNGKPNYANFTQLVISQDMDQLDAQRYVNDFTDIVSMDMYWYTIPFCNLQPYRANYLIDTPQATCRTSRSYGRSMEMLAMQDAADGKRQPLWNFVEFISGGPAEGTNNPQVTPQQQKGAVMASIVNEARGIVWFNTTFSGSCEGGTLRLAQVQGPGSCAWPYAESLKEVNNQIHMLAPVINTQSYKWEFGPDLDTMLKVHDGYVYIFAMTEGTDGTRSFALPAGIKGQSVEVLFEGRQIPIRENGFVDSFERESSYHIYKIKL